MSQADTRAPVTITDRAVRKVASLVAQPEYKGLMLRLAVNGGGCSGFEYSFSFDDDVRADDTIIEKDGVKVLIDQISLEVLAGSEIDYVDELVGAAFTVRNPNATSSCGCGNSFSL